MLQPDPFSLSQWPGRAPLSAQIFPRPRPEASARSHAGYPVANLARFVAEEPVRGTHAAAGRQVAHGQRLVVQGARTSQEVQASGLLGRAEPGRLTRVGLYRLHRHRRGRVSSKQQGSSFMP